MFKKAIKIIHDLRVFFFAFILISSLYSLGVNPMDLGKFIGAKFTYAIGVSTSTSVPANPFNSLALQLQEKQKMLDQRERDLNQKEVNLNSGGLLSQRALLYLLISGVVVLFVLILMNFYFDYRRRHNTNK